jgi:hypothetical protein
MKVNWRFGEICFPQLQRLFAVCLIQVLCLDYSSKLKIEATCSSGKSPEFYLNTRRLIPNTEHFITTTVRTSNPISKTYIIVREKEILFCRMLSLIFSYQFNSTKYLFLGAYELHNIGFHLHQCICWSLVTKINKLWRGTWFSCNVRQ